MEDGRRVLQDWCRRWYRGRSRMGAGLQHRRVWGSLQDHQCFCWTLSGSGMEPLHVPPRTAISSTEKRRFGTGSPRSSGRLSTTSAIWRSALRRGADGAATALAVRPLKGLPNDVKAHLGMAKASQLADVPEAFKQILDREGSAARSITMSANLANPHYTYQRDMELLMMWDKRMAALLHASVSPITPSTTNSPPTRR